MLVLDLRVNLEGWHVLTLRAAADSGHCDVVDLLVRDDRISASLDRAFALRYYCLAGDMSRA
jgi:hypothetical protein